MSTINQAAAAFVKAQREFAPALKTHTNPAFRSKYADLAACIEAVVDALNSNGLAVMQLPKPSEKGVTVETVFVHESGEILHGGELTVPAAKQDPQGYGSALTYARRYGLMAACGIAPEDDDGNAASKQANQQRQPAGRPQQRGEPRQDIAAQVKNVIKRVKEQDATGAAEWLASLAEAQLNALWTKLPADVQDELTSVWPETAGAAQ